jgi:hypothetical protein
MLLMAILGIVVPYINCVEISLPVEGVSVIYGYNCVTAYYTDCHVNMVVVLDQLILDDHFTYK